jgi:hypothetical protein
MYFVRVRAITAAGAGAWGSGQDGATVWDTPGAPVLVFLGSGGEPSPYLLLMWSHSETREGTVLDMVRSSAQPSGAE